MAPSPAEALPLAAPGPHRGAWTGSRPARWLPGVLSLLLLVLGQVAAAGPASAHDYLISTSPVSGATADASPPRVTLTFNEPVNTRFSTVEVTGPSGGLWQNGASTVLGATVTQPLRTLGPAGPYRVTWRVVSADGHPVDGTFTFTLRTAGNGTPAAAAPGGGTGDAGSGSGDWVPLAATLAVLALLLGGASAALTRRRRSAAEAPATAVGGRG
jgi:copper resistance protein C